MTSYVLPVKLNDAQGAKAVQNRRETERNFPSSAAALGKTLERKFPVDGIRKMNLLG